MKFYFVRHGKTQWNLEGRFQGANGDSPLLEESVHDLEKLGDYLQDVKFDAVFSCLAATIQSQSAFNPRCVNGTLEDWKAAKLQR